MGPGESDKGIRFVALLPHGTTHPSQPCTGIDVRWYNANHTAGHESVISLGAEMFSFQVGFFSVSLLFHNFRLGKVSVLPSSYSFFILNSRLRGFIVGQQKVKQFPEIRI